MRRTVSLRDKVLFGSDFPVLTPDKWLEDLEQTKIKPELYPRILKGNAARLLVLGAVARAPAAGIT